jgi:hypothetical protein
MGTRLSERREKRRPELCRSKGKWSRSSKLSRKRKLRKKEKGLKLLRPRGKSKRRPRGESKTIRMRVQLLQTASAQK